MPALTRNKMARPYRTHARMQRAHTGKHWQKTVPMPLRLPKEDTRDQNTVSIVSCAAKGETQEGSQTGGATQRSNLKTPRSTANDNKPRNQKEREHHKRNVIYVRCTVCVHV